MVAVTVEVGRGEDLGQAIEGLDGGKAERGAAVQVGVREEVENLVYNEGRSHQGIEGIPEYGPGSPRTLSSRSRESLIKVATHPVLGGLHPDYRRPA